MLRITLKCSWTLPCDAWARCRRCPDVRRSRRRPSCAAASPVRAWTWYSPVCSGCKLQPCRIAFRCSGRSCWFRRARALCWRRRLSCLEPTAAHIVKYHIVLINSEEKAANTLSVSSKRCVSRKCPMWFTPNCSSMPSFVKLLGHLITPALLIRMSKRLCSSLNLRENNVKKPPSFRFNALTF